MGRRIYPDRESNYVSENDGCERNDKSHQQPVADDLVHRQVIRKGVAHVSVEKPHNPVEVLLPERPVETVLYLKEMYLGQIGSLARALQLSDISGEIIARWKINYSKY